MEVHICETEEGEKAYLFFIYYGSFNGAALLFSHNIPANRSSCSGFLHCTQFTILQMSALWEASWKERRRLLPALWKAD